MKRAEKLDAFFKKNYRQFRICMAQGECACTGCTKSMVKLWAQSHPEEGRIIPDEWKNYGSIYGKSDHEIMKEKLAELRETLPTRFSSWVEFYNRVKDSMDKYDGKIEVISWSEYIPGDRIYEPGEENPNAQDFKVDFIKARCFDEIMLLYPEVSDPGGLYGDDVSSFYTVGKIDEIMGYKRENYN